MDFEKLWNRILRAATKETFYVSTVPQNNRTPLWFKVYTKEAYLYVDNTPDNSPSVQLSGTRKVSKDDFINVAGYYERWKKGETPSKAGSKRTVQEHSVYLWIDIKIRKFMITI